MNRDTTRMLLIGCALTGLSAVLAHITDHDPIGIGFIVAIAYLIGLTVALAVQERPQ